MEFTGEQVVLGGTKQRLVDEDLARYRFASGFVAGKRVLDIACGTGIGCVLYAPSAARVVGVDISSESIAHAKKNAAAANIEYRVASADQEDLFPAASFDVISSLETIEHLEEASRKRYLANLARWLVPGGVVILSTPNKRVTSPFSDKPENAFHVLEFTKEHLLSELSPYFIVREWYGQRAIPKLLSIPIIRRFVHLYQRVVGKNFHIYTLSGSPEVLRYDEQKVEPRIFVALLSPRTNPPDVRV